ncbi:3'-5' exonuclease, partial [Pseudostreptobacillus hongkongensis]|uniref:3'-5' exonuclease n=1 Tax=Pseudostreptobacillus hongkongensis TaxID=1162717 RepID=UPI000A90A58C
DKIIEIGADKLKAGKVVSKISEFVNSEKPIPQKNIEITSINENMVRDAETIENVMTRFIDFVNDCTLVAHNAQFDV